MTKVLLDTDIGTDVDDAVCLAYLLSHPDCELLGITTVTGEAVKRASLASVLCKAAGRDIPIYPGAEHPMQGEQRQPIAQQATALPRWPHETNFPINQAVDFLANTIRSSSGRGDAFNHWASDQYRLIVLSPSRCLRAARRFGNDGWEL